MYESNFLQAAPKRKKRVTVGTVIFYTLYFVFILAAALATRQAYLFLEDWLVRYEASQPDAKSQEIFAELFENPDWGNLYTMGQLPSTAFEGKDAYIQYMENKVGSQKLTYSMSSAGLSGGRKYIVRLGEEKIASFIIENAVTGELEIPDWKLSQVEVVDFPRRQSVTIYTQEGCTVTVNGIPLEESYIVRTTTSAVDNYLPEGVFGRHTVTFYADNFLVAPDVLVIDQAGDPVEMVYDEAAATYCEAGLDQFFSPIPEEERKLLVEATQNYGCYVIGVSGTKLSKYVDTASEIYQIIINTERLFKGYSSYEFTEPEITEYCRYSDTLFSAKIRFDLNTYRYDGSVKPFQIDTTVFMSLTGKGWRIVNMSNADVHEVTTMVRLTWMQDGQVLESVMVDASTGLLTPPAPTAPEGKEFAGWFMESVDENGDVTLTRVFMPTESGTISLPNDYALEPMVLHARFETKGE